MLPAQSAPKRVGSHADPLVAVPGQPPVLTAAQVPVAHESHGPSQIVAQQKLSVEQKPLRQVASPVHV